MEGIDSTVQAETDRNDGVKPAKAKRPKSKKPAAKKAKPKTKKKPVKKVKKPAKRRPKAKTSKPKRKPGAKPKPSNVVRSERLDMRLTKAEKAKVSAKAKKLRRTVTSIVIEAIEKLK